MRISDWSSDVCSSDLRTEDSIRRLGAARPYGAPLPSTISVLHSANNYRDIYHYLRDLGVEELNFHLPDRNLDDAAFRASDKAAEYAIGSASCRERVCQSV